MSYYFIAKIKIVNDALYQKYLDGADNVFEKFNGEYLAVDDFPEVLEGGRKHGRTVIIKFETKDEFEDWYFSKEYQELLKYRLGAADCDAILVRGLDA